MVSFAQSGRDSERAIHTTNGKRSIASRAGRTTSTASADPLGADIESSLDGEQLMTELERSTRAIRQFKQFGSLRLLSPLRGESTMRCISNTSHEPCSQRGQPPPLPV